MAETKPNAAAKTASPKASGNAISYLAPIICLIAGYCIWRFILGNPDSFTKPDLEGGFWPSHKGPKGAWNRAYEGGIIVPLLIGCFLMVVTFSIERFLTIKRATGSGAIGEFVRKVQFHLANKNVDAAIAECDKQKLNTEQKVHAIQKEVEEATALELPMLQKNLVFLSTLTSLGTLVALLGTVLGMIKSFSSLGEEGGSGAAAELAVGISEALYNTALGIATSSVALLMYNVFTTRIDSITYGIDESGFTLTQSFVSQYK